MNRPFFWLITVFMLILALGIFLLVTGIQTSPYTLPFGSSI